MNPVKIFKKKKNRKKKPEKMAPPLKKVKVKEAVSEEPQSQMEEPQSQMDVVSALTPSET